MAGHWLLGGAGLIELDRRAVGAIGLGDGCDLGCKKRAIVPPLLEGAPTRHQAPGGGVVHRFTMVHHAWGCGACNTRRGPGVACGPSRPVWKACACLCSGRGQDALASAGLKSRHRSCLASPQTLSVHPPGHLPRNAPRSPYKHTLAPLPSLPPNHAMPSTTTTATTATHVPSYEVDPSSLVRYSDRVSEVDELVKLPMCDVIRGTCGGRPISGGQA